MLSPRQLCGRVRTTPPEWAGLQSLEPRILMAATSLNRVRILNATAAEGDAGTTTMAFTVKRTGGPQLVNGRTVVRFTTDESLGANPADEGIDYQARTGRVVFRPGESTQTVLITINGDVDQESNDRFFVTLVSVKKGVIVDGEARGTIIDDDSGGGGGGPSISINNQSIAETDAGTTNMSFTVTLNAVSAQVVTVDYATSDGTATTADLDYGAESGTLTFNPGETTKNILVTINGDPVVEANEQFTVNLSNPVNASLNDGVGLGVIQNDD